MQSIWFLYAKSMQERQVYEFYMHWHVFLLPFCVELCRNTVEIVLDFLWKQNSGYNFSILRGIVQFVVHFVHCHHCQSPNCQQIKSSNWIRSCKQPQDIQSTTRHRQCAVFICSSFLYCTYLQQTKYCLASPLPSSLRRTRTYNVQHDVLGCQSSCYCLLLHSRLDEIKY